MPACLTPSTPSSITHPGAPGRAKNGLLLLVALLALCAAHARTCAAQDRLHVYDGGDEVAGALLGPFVEGGTIPRDAWARAVVPVAGLGLPAGVYDSIVLQSWSGSDQGTLYFDDIDILVNAAPPEPVTVLVDPAADRRPIDPLIYGVNLGDTDDFGALSYPCRRWGGNATTRYSWENDTSNRASDWFFINIANDDPGTLPDNSAADRFIDETLAASSAPILTMPLIGWTPRDRTKRWGFSVAKYGAQQVDECDWGAPPWCAADAGNGVLMNGDIVTGNDPHDTSIPIGPNWVVDWKRHIEGRVGTASQGGLRFIDLDNEPMLWNHTHRDVHPDPVSYDEIWQRTSAYAAALKAQDPGVRTLGPVVWGWCAYFHSAVDGCAPGADQAAHGGMEFLPWYLDQVRAYEQQHGVRLVDYLDIHYYPQAPNVALSDDESPGTSALRLRTVKSLYDASYVDESWIGQPVRLIPRMRAWIDAHAPGTKLAITEYNWGSDDGISSALAQAEVLAVFGREGVDLATRWVAPEAGSRCVDAFRMFLDHDGAGSALLGESVRATTTNADNVAAYAIDAPGTDLHVLLFNKSTAPTEVTVRVADDIPDGPASLYRFDAQTPFGPAGAGQVSGGSLNLSLPARSATLAVVVQSEVAANGTTRVETSHDLTVDPAPFRDEAVIRYRLAVASPVRVTVHDVAGRTLRVLRDTPRAEAGTHTVSWDGTDSAGRPVPSGMYVVKFEASGRTATRRILRIE